MRTDSQRSDQYNAKTAATTVGLKVAAVLAGMKSGFATAINDLVPIEQQVQGLLNAAGVPTIHYPFYLCFGREVWSLSNRGINGATLTLMAQASKDKWTTRGLTSARLIEIADTVFSVTVT